MWDKVFRSFNLKSFKSCLPQILLGPFLNTLPHVNSLRNLKTYIPQSKNFSTDKVHRIYLSTTQFITIILTTIWWTCINLLHFVLINNQNICINSVADSSCILLQLENYLNCLLHWYLHKKTGYYFTLCLSTFGFWVLLFPYFSMFLQKPNYRCVFRTPTNTYDGASEGKIATAFGC